MSHEDQFDTCWHCGTAREATDVDFSSVDRSTETVLPEHSSRAKSDRISNADKRHDSMWTCSECGEAHDSQFEFCWKCGTAVDGEIRVLLDHDQWSNDDTGISPNLLVGTTHVLDGIAITEYLGFVSGKVVMGTGILTDMGASIRDLLGTRASGFQNKLAKAETAALHEMTKNAQSVSANAIIGVDVDYTVVFQGMLMVIANGTAVRIEEHME